MRLPQHELGLCGRDKARILVERLGRPWTRDAVYAAALRCGLSLHPCNSWDEMELPLLRVKLRDDDVPDIVAALESGCTMADVADYYGVCPKTVQSCMRRAGILSRHDLGPSDDEVADAIRSLRTDFVGFSNTGVTLTHGARPPEGGVERRE